MSYLYHQQCFNEQYDNDNKIVLNLTYEEIVQLAKDNTLKDKLNAFTPMQRAEFKLNLRNNLYQELVNFIDEYITGSI